MPLGGGHSAVRIKNNRDIAYVAWKFQCHREGRKRSLGGDAFDDAMIQFRKMALFLSWRGRTNGRTKYGGSGTLLVLVI